MNEDEAWSSRIWCTPRYLFIRQNTRYVFHQHAVSFLLDFPPSMTNFYSLSVIDPLAYGVAYGVGGLGVGLGSFSVGFRSRE